MNSMPVRDMLLAVMVAAIWGGNFVAARYGVAHFPPFFLTCLRFTLVASVMIPFCPRPTRLQAKQLFILALVLGTLHLAAMFAAMHQGLDIAACAIVAQLGVPFSCLLGALWMGDRLGIWRISGMALAFAGMMLVAGTPNVLEHPLGFSIAIGGAFFWALSNIQIKRIEGMPPMAMLAWMTFFAAPQLLLISLLLESGQWDSLVTLTRAPALSLLYTAFGSTVTAYGMWYVLLKRYPVSLVAPYSLLTPVFGIALGQLFFKEPLTAAVLIGGALTMLGVGVIVFRRPKLAELSEAT